MGIKEFFQQFFEECEEKGELEETVKETLQEVQGTFQNAETKEEGIENAVGKAIDVIIEQEEDKDKELLAERLLQAMEENGDLPRDVRIKVIEEMLKNEEIPNEIPIIGIQNSDKLNEEEIEKIAKTTEDIKVKREILNEIPNDEKRKKALQEIAGKLRREKESEMKQKLKHIYATCHELQGGKLQPINEFIDDLLEIKQKSTNPDIMERINRVLARRVAIEWKIIGTARMPEIMRVLSPEEMLEIDFPSIVEEEFASTERVDLSPMDLKKFYEYSKEKFQERISTQLDEKKKRNKEEEKCQSEKKKAYRIEDLIRSLQALPKVEQEKYLKSFIETIEQGNLRGQQSLKGTTDEGVR